MPADITCDCGKPGAFRIDDRLWCYGCHESMRAALERLAAVARAAVVARRLSPAAVMKLADRLETGPTKAELAAMLPETQRRRGVDFPCEGCGKLDGSNLDNGWWRCASCGFPGK